MWLHDPFLLGVPIAETGQCGCMTPYLLGVSVVGRD